LDFAPNFIPINIKIKSGEYIMTITKETVMGDMLQYDMGIAYVLMEAGMHCVGCPSSIGESLEEACMVHGLDADAVLKNIEDYLAAKEANK
jgi:hybrid cluster-associated redox disulfide protein